MQMRELECVLGTRLQAPLYGWEIRNVPDHKYYIENQNQYWSEDRSMYSGADPGILEGGGGPFANAEGA